MRSIRPLTGLRFTWQSNTLMKIETRVSGFTPRPSSAGGTALMMRLTRPSAGATTMPSRTGVTRGGSRKKEAHHPVNRVPIQPSGDQIQKRTRLSSAKAPMKGSPSPWIGASCERMDFSTDIRRSTRSWSRHPEVRAQRASKDDRPDQCNTHARGTMRAVALRGSAFGRAPQGDGETTVIAAKVPHLPLLLRLRRRRHDLIHRRRYRLGDRRRVAVGRDFV